MRSLTVLMCLVLAGAASAQEVAGDLDTLGAQVELETGGHVAQVARVLFTPDNQFAVTVGYDRTIRYWDVATGELHKTLRLHYYIVAEVKAQGVAVSPDGTLLAIRQTGRSILLVNVPSGQVERIVRLPKMAPHFIVCLAFSPDGKRLALGTANLNAAKLKTDDSQGVFVCDPASGTILQEIRGKYGPIQALAWSADGKRLAAAGGYNGPNLFLFNLEGQGRVEYQAQAPGKTARWLTWAQNGQVVWIGADEGVQAWNPNANKLTRMYPVGATNALIHVPRDGGMITAGETSPTVSRVSLLDLKSGQETRRFETKTAFPPHPHSLALSRDRKVLAAVTGATHVLHLWQFSDGKLLHRLAGKGVAFSAAGWSRSGSVIAWGRGRPPSATGYFEQRPLQFAFDLKQLARPEAKPDFSTFQRAVLKGKSGVLEPDRKGPLLVRDSAKLNLQVFGGGHVGTCGTLLSHDRAAVGCYMALQLLNTKTGERILHSKGGIASPFPHCQDDLRDMAPSPDDKFLLTACQDQRLRIYHVGVPGEEKLLLTLFFAGQEWIVWTPQGFYAATPGGEKLMGWVVNQGLDKPKAFYPADRFRSQLYRPDIIKLVLEKGSVAEAVRAADAVRKEKTRLADIDDLLPPNCAVELVNHDKGKVTLRIQAQARAKGQPILGLRLYVDGRPFVPGGNRGIKRVNASEVSAEFPEGKDKADVTWTINLPGEKAAGAYQLAVVAKSKDAQAPSNIVAVSYVNPAKVPALHVLTIGVNKYDDATLNLNFATKDAKELATAFEKHKKAGLFSDVHATTLLDKDANRQAILDNIQKVREKVKENDLFVVFFAGHGVKEKEQFYLLTVEAKVNALEKSTLSGKDLRQGLGEFPCQVLLMLDACHSAGFGEKGKLRNQKFQPATDDATRALTEDEIGVAVMCAAMGNEAALEKDGNGLFTRAVLDALRRAEGVFYNPSDHQLYTHHLQAFVFDQVSRQSNGRQHPHLYLPWVVQNFPVAKFSAK